MKFGFDKELTKVWGHFAPRWMILQDVDLDLSALGLHVLIPDLEGITC